MENAGLRVTVVTCQYRRGGPGPVSPVTESCAQLLNVMVGSNGGAGMGAYTLVGSVVGTVGLLCFAAGARASHTD